jgi:hypothetical protein
MIVTVITGAMVKPACCAVDESRWVERLDSSGETKFRVSLNDLAPSLVINDLKERSVPSKYKRARNLRLPM